MTMQTDLFSFAYIPAWFEQLYTLAQLATPEPWRYKNPEYETQNTETPILERYINQIFRKQAVEYNCASESQADAAFYIRNEFACFHKMCIRDRHYPNHTIPRNPPGNPLSQALSAPMG